MPELRARPGTDLVAAEGVTVAGRLDRPVSLTLRSGDRVVVTGANGAGKSTLLSVLAGLVEPTGGGVRTARTVRVRLLAQESPRAGARRAHEVYSAHVARLVGSGALAEGEAVPLSALGLLPARDTARPLRELSMGQQRRLDLAVALASRPDVLLLDEPTNHLSIALVEELTEGLGSTGAAVVIATHDRQLRRDTASWERLDLRPGTSAARIAERSAAGGA
ncbi:ATP-binding cassette domain-containing protein [Nocardiopsis sp. ARC36]